MNLRVGKARHYIAHRVELRLIIGALKAAIESNSLLPDEAWYFVDSLGSSSQKEGTFCTASILLGVSTNNWSATALSVCLSVQSQLHISFLLAYH